MGHLGTGHIDQMKSGKGERAPTKTGFESRVRKIMDIGNQGMRTLIDGGRESDFCEPETFLSSWLPIDFL